MMASPTFTSANQAFQDTPTWESLKRAIAASSGFKRWQLQADNAVSADDTTLDEVVMRYLRETLETLAY
ncbi:MAG: hypothetical protein VKK04_17235 [Synechococcales bacterium]|nr:hypothetical protein [Synechococcales bacterium]